MLIFNLNSLFALSYLTAYCLLFNYLKHHLHWIFNLENDIEMMPKRRFNFVSILLIHIVCVIFNILFSTYSSVILSWNIWLLLLLDNLYSFHMHAVY